MSRKRRTHSPDFKAKVALAAIKGDETLSELARRYQINDDYIMRRVVRPGEGCNK